MVTLETDTSYLTIMTLTYGWMEHSGICLVFQRFNVSGLTKMGSPYRDNGGKLWVLYSKDNSNTLDIWHIKGDTVHPYKYVHRWDMPKQFIFPIRLTNFSGIQTYVPGDPDGYCEWRYGMNWRSEKNCTKVKNRKCLV